MNKERVKSAVLAFLVVFNLVLAERILVDKKLWPTGYNFFSIRTGNSTDFEAKKHLVTPERIIINTGYQSSRFEYLHESREFEKTLAEANEILEYAFSKSSRDLTLVASENWYSALTGKSVYLSFPCKFSAKSFSELIDISGCEFDIKGFSDIVISESGDVYISDTYQNCFYKITTKKDNVSLIIEEAMAENELETSVINYSFDLNFDKDFGDQRTFLSPMIAIYSAPFEAEVISSQNPLFKDGEPNQKVINSILSAFSISSGSVWRYTEADGSIVFVENNGVLKISPDGILNYTASDTGIKLFDDISTPVHRTAAEVAGFVNEINQGIGFRGDICLTSPLTDSGNTAFTFDYLINGLPVKYPDRSGIHITVQNGYITGFTQVLRRYIPLGFYEFSPLYIEALDSVIAKYRDAMQQINITKMLPAYTDNLEIGEKLPDWFIDIDNVVAE